MWIAVASLSVLYAGATAILAKCGIQKVNSNVATALRTGVVLIFSWLMVFWVGSQDTVTEIPPKTLIFLVLSGLSTGASWLCYYGALHDPQALTSVVVPIDKLSVVVTVIFSRIFLKERLSRRAAFGLVLLVAGTLLQLL